MIMNYNAMYPYPIPILCKCSCSCSLYLVTVLTACCSEHCSEGPVPRHTLYTALAHDTLYS